MAGALELSLCQEHPEDHQQDAIGHVLREHSLTDGAAGRIARKAAQKGEGADDEDDHADELES